jgi:hypothetical protein
VAVSWRRKTLYHHYWLNVHVQLFSTEAFTKTSSYHIRHSWNISKFVVRHKWIILLLWQLNLIVIYMTCHPLSLSYDYLCEKKMLYHSWLRVECTLFCNLKSRVRTHAILMIGLYELYESQFVVRHKWIILLLWQLNLIVIYMTCHPLSLSYDYLCEKSSIT